MNQYPLWKYLLIIFVMIISVFYALPNIYGKEPAVQVSAAKREFNVDQKLIAEIETLLKDKKIEVKRMGLVNNRLVLNFADTDVQLVAKDTIEAAIGPNYAVALNLVPATPEWLNAMNALPMYLGLDLRGGVHFLMEVDMDSAIRTKEERYVSTLRTLLRGEKIRYLTIARRPSRDDLPSGVEIRFRDVDMRDKARNVIRDADDDLESRDIDRGGDLFLLVSLKVKAIRDTKRFALQQNITTLRNRVNELGVAEPIIQQQGSDRIVVQLPGIQDPARARDILGKTATLEYRMVDYEHDAQEALKRGAPAGSKIYYDRQGKPILLKKQVIVTGDQITDASSGFDQQTGSPAVFVSLDSKGGRKMGKTTRANLNKPMAVVFIETRTEVKMVDGKTVRTQRKIEEVINVANIRGEFSNRFQTSGLDNTEEASDLALLLRAGALAAPVTIVEERTVGPSLGKDNIDQGFLSVQIGFVMVLIFMAVYYRAFGMIANLALLLNLVLIVAVLSMLQATLTLPGIAGIVLTVGMAVDANVLIFERIREEIRNGNTPQASISAGYEKALSTIADANVTTLIAAIVLFAFGTGSIKGFAITLSIGIVTSMFTAIMGTRAVVNLIYGKRRVSKLSI